MTSTSSAAGCCVATLQRFTCWLPFLFCCASGDSSSNFCRLCFVLRFWNQTFTCGRTHRWDTNSGSRRRPSARGRLGLLWEWMIVAGVWRCVFYPICSLSHWGFAFSCRRSHRPSVCRLLKSKTIIAAVFVKDVAMATCVTIHADFAAGKTRRRGCPNTSQSLTWICWAPRGLGWHVK